MHACECMSENLPVYLHALLLTLIFASVFVHIVFLFPSCVSVSEVMTEKPQPSFAWAAAPGRFGQSAVILFEEILFQPEQRA